MGGIFAASNRQASGVIGPYASPKDARITAYPLHGWAVQMVSEYQSAAFGQAMPSFVNPGSWSDFTGGVTPNRLTNGIASFTGTQYKYATALGTTKPSAFSFCVKLTRGSTARMSPFGSIDAASASALGYALMEIKANGDVEAAWGDGTNFRYVKANGYTMSTSTVTTIACKSDGTLAGTKWWINGTPYDSVAGQFGGTANTMGGTLQPFAVGRMGAYASGEFHVGNIYDFALSTAYESDATMLAVSQWMMQDAGVRTPPPGIVIPPAELLVDVQYPGGTTLDYSRFKRAVNLASGSVVSTNPPPDADYSYLSTGAQNVIIGDSSMPTVGTGDVSIEVKFRVNAFQSDFAHILARREGSACEWLIFARTGAIEFYTTNSFVLLNVSTTIALNTWYTYRFVRKDGEYQHHLNDVVIGTGSNSANWGSSGGGLRLGYDSSNSGTAGTKQIGRVRIFNDARLWID